TGRTPGRMFARQDFPEQTDGDNRGAREYPAPRAPAPHSNPTGRRSATGGGPLPLPSGPRGRAPRRLARPAHGTRIPWPRTASTGPGTSPPPRAVVDGAAPQCAVRIPGGRPRVRIATNGPGLWIAPAVDRRVGLGAATIGMATGAGRRGTGS